MNDQTQMKSPVGRKRIAAAFFLATAFILSVVWTGSGPGTPPNRTYTASDRAGRPTSSMCRCPQRAAAKNVPAGAVIPQGDAYLAAHITFRMIASAVLRGDEAVAVTAGSEKCAKRPWTATDLTE